MSPTFLLIGQSWDDVRKLFDDPAKADELIKDVRHQLDESIKSFEVVGAKLHIFNWDHEKGMKALDEVLESENWIGVLVGGGLRTNPKFSDLFADIVNEVHAKVPNAKMAFNTQPNNAFEAMEHVIPSIGQ